MMRSGCHYQELSSGAGRQEEVFRVDAGREPEVEPEVSGCFVTVVRSGNSVFPGNSMIFERFDYLPCLPRPWKALPRVHPGFPGRGVPLRESRRKVAHTSLRVHSYSPDSVITPGNCTTASSLFATIG